MSCSRDDWCVIVIVWRIGGMHGDGVFGGSAGISRSNRTGKAIICRGVNWCVDRTASIIKDTINVKVT
jgi:hypothetical protein